MSAMADIRAGIVTSLRLVYPDGVQIGAYAVSNPTPPTLQLLAGGVEYHMAMHDGLDHYTLMLQGIVGLSEDGQRLLDTWMDPGATGLQRVVEADQTLGSTVANVIVRTCSPVRSAVVGGIDYLLAEWEIDVYPEGP